MRSVLILLGFLICLSIYGQRVATNTIEVAGSNHNTATGVRGLTLFPGNWLNATNTLVYTNGDKSYVNGTNNFGDRAKAERFKVEKPYYIIGASFWIGAIEGNEGEIHFNIWDFDIIPTQVIATKSLSISYLKEHVNLADPFYIEFDTPVLVSKDYVIGVELSDVGASSFALVSSENGDGGRLDLVYEQWSTGEWYSYLSPSSWGLDIDLGIFPSIEDVVISDDFESGSGTLSDPYAVRTATQLNQVRNYLSSYFIQVADIDLGNSPWNEAAGWVPIGNPRSPFTGNYNGNGYSVKNMTIDRPENDYQGLFGFIKNGGVKNIKLTSALVHANRYAGILAGYCEKCTLIQINCAGSVTGSDFTGGLAGSANIATLEKLSTHADVKGQKYTGGLIGFLAGESQLQESFTYGHVEGSEQTGGLTGMVSGQSSEFVTSGNGVIAVLPPQVYGTGHGMTLTDADPSSILRHGEIQASPVVKIGITGIGLISGNSEEGEGFPVYEMRFPVTIQNADENRLRVRVRMREDTRLPVFGNYDKETKTYTIFTYGLINDWVMGVVLGDPVTRTNNNRPESGGVRRNSTWKTFDFDIIDDSDLSLIPAPIRKTDIETYIAPITRDALKKYQAAGFKPPKLYTEANKNAYKLHLINTDQPGHSAISGSSYYYSPDHANLLGGIYIFYTPNYIPDPQQPSTWRLDYVISHEIFHSIQNSYGYTSDIVQSAFFNGDASIATSYEEGTATLVGGTYTKYKRVDDGNVTLHAAEAFLGLSNAYDDYNINPYSKQDFFAFLSKRYFNGSLVFLGPMWQYIADSWKKDYTKLLLFYREGLDKFLKSKGKNLPRAYTDFAMQRLYIHDPEYLLRDQSAEDPSPNNWFAKNFLTSFLLQEGKTYKKWNSSDETVYDYAPIKIESMASLTSAAIVMKMPDMVPEENKKDSIELKLALSANVNINQNLDEEGIRIVIIRANTENGNPVENNASVVLKDISKPFKISLKDGVTHLVFIVINAYTQFIETDIILEQKKENEFISVNIIFEGNHTWEIVGTHIKPLSDPKKMEFGIGSSPDFHDHDLKWTLTDFISEGGFQLAGFYYKLKVVGRLSSDKKKLEYIDYFYESNLLGNTGYVVNRIKIEDIDFGKALGNGIEFSKIGPDVKFKVSDVEHLEKSGDVEFPPDSNYRKYLSTEYNSNTKIRIQFLY